MQPAPITGEPSCIPSCTTAQPTCSRAERTAIAMQELDGGRGPRDDSTRFRSNREEVTYGQGNTRYSDSYEGYGFNRDRTHGSGLNDTDSWGGPNTAHGRGNQPQMGGVDRGYGAPYMTDPMFGRASPMTYPPHDPYGRYGAGFHPMPPEFMGRQYGYDQRPATHPATMRAPPHFGNGYGYLSPGAIRAAFGIRTAV